MAVDEPNEIDFVSTNKEETVTFLTIRDHLDWSDSLKHQVVLQDKFNAYLRFAESGEMVDRFPRTKGLAVVFDVRCMHSPDDDGMVFLEHAREVIESAGFSLQCKILNSQVQ